MYNPTDLLKYEFKILKNCLDLEFRRVKIHIMYSGFYIKMYATHFVKIYLMLDFRRGCQQFERNKY